MSNKPTLSIIASLCLLFILAGCATDRGVHHFTPSPAAKVRSHNIEPAKPKLVTELVQSAQNEFAEANAAQEQGDREAAIQHYAKMLDLLKEANLDPSAFYNLRSEFERIVTSQPAAAPSPDGQVTAPEGQSSSEVQQAFEAANAAQEKGDREAALREYTHMLDLLGKNNADPAGFYNLRSEFERVLATGEKQARIYDRKREEEWKHNLTPPAAMGEIEIEEPLSERVLTEIDEIMNLYPRNFQGGLDRSHKYLPYVKEQFAQAGLPEDLVYLAMVESQFSPKVVSKAGAAGMWQFMKATGVRYGLKTDRYVDDRFNWKKATQAAVRHLADLYEHFDGAWPLAVSAYNMGEGGVDRAVASAGGERNLWKLVEVSDSMQMETKKFYPKLLASVIVAKDPERFGFTWTPQAAEDTVTVPIRGSYTLSALDRALELPEGTLRQLNPDLVRGVTPPSDEFALSVPSGASEKLASVISDLPQVRPDILRGFDKKRVYVVRRGDTLETVAKKCGISVDDLLKANRLKADSRLSTGRRLSVPGENLDIEDVERLTAPEEKETPAAEPAQEPEEKVAKKREPGSVMRTYTVKPGDTLENIAKKQKISLKTLLALNKIRNQAMINAGDKLQLTPLDEIQEKPEPAETTHVVQNGDSPAKIAKLYGVQVDDLLQWNNLSKTSAIHAGEKLVVRGIQEQKTEAAADDGQEKEKVEFKVAKGDTASTIAAKYGVKVSEFLTWNNLTAKSVLHEGDACSVYVKSDKPKAEAKTASKEKEAKAAKAEPEQKPKADAKPDAKKDTKVAKAEPEQKPKADAKPDAKKDTKVAKAEPEQKPKSDAKPDAKKAAPKQTTHVVAKGDNPSTIASRYKVKVSDLYKWNNWNKNVVLQLGQKVAIQKD